MWKIYLYLGLAFLMGVAALNQKPMAILFELSLDGDKINKRLSDKKFANHNKFVGKTLIFGSILFFLIVFFRPVN